MAVPCSRAHYWEVFAVIGYPAGANDAYPGDAWLYTYASDECRPYFESYTGEDPASSRLSFLSIVPDEGSWAAGGRQIVCELYKPTGSSPLREQIAGSHARKSGPFGSQPATSAPATTGGAREALAGKWTGVDAASGAVFLLQFGGDGGLRILYYGSGRDGVGGQYEWDGPASVRLTFDGWTDGAQQEGFCPRVPAFLERFCQTRVADPAAYPGPEEPAGPPPSTAAGGTPWPYPAPSPAPVVFSHIDEVFAVTIAGDTLTLAHASGVEQSFQRGQVTQLSTLASPSTPPPNPPLSTPTPNPYPAASSGTMIRGMRRWRARAALSALCPRGLASFGVDEGAIVVGRLVWVWRWWGGCSQPTRSAFMLTGTYHMMYAPTGTRVTRRAGK